MLRTLLFSLWLPLGVAALGLSRFGLQGGLLSPAEVLMLLAAWPGGIPLTWALRRLDARSRPAAVTSAALLCPLAVGAATVGGLLGPPGIWLFAGIVSLPAWIAVWLLQWRARRHDAPDTAAGGEARQPGGSCNGAPGVTMPDASLAQQTARELVAGASRIVGFTGAGISTESGVPDFRSPDGVWARNRTVYFQEFVASEADRIEYWRQKVEGWPAMRAARPNAGHYAFVALHEQGRLAALITQNIERLHQRSGLPGELVMELHGAATEAVCLTCGDRLPMDEACRRVTGGEPAPRCRACGGLLKPATVSFGQAMPQEVMRRAYAAAGACDLLLAVGSSLVVEPAASIPRVAKGAGARLIIVNREPTPLDAIADVVVHGEIGDVLPALVQG